MYTRIRGYMYTVQYDSSDLYAFLVLNVCTVTKFRSKVSEATYEVAIPRYTMCSTYIFLML